MTYIFDDHFAIIHHCSQFELHLIKVMLVDFAGMVKRGDRVEENLKIEIVSSSRHLG